MTARVNEQGARTNADVVRETYEAVGRGDIPALLNLLTEDVEWTLQGPTVIPYLKRPRASNAGAVCISASNCVPGGSRPFAHCARGRKEASSGS
jgi:hypothetical protein